MFKSGRRGRDAGAREILALGLDDNDPTTVSEPSTRHARASHSPTRSFARLKSSRTRAHSTFTALNGSRRSQLLPAHFPEDASGHMTSSLPELPLLSPLTMSTGSDSLAPLTDGPKRTPSNPSFASPSPSRLSIAPAVTRHRSVSTIERARSAMDPQRPCHGLPPSMDRGTPPIDGEMEGFFRAHGFGQDSPERRAAQRPDSDVEEIDDFSEAVPRQSFATNLKRRRRDIFRSKAEEEVEEEYSDTSISDAHRVSDSESSDEEFEDAMQVQADDQMPDSMLQSALSPLQVHKQRSISSFIGTNRSKQALKAVRRPPALDLGGSMRRQGSTWQHNLATPPSALLPALSVVMQADCKDQSALQHKSAPASPTAKRVRQHHQRVANTTWPRSAGLPRSFDADGSAPDIVIAVVGAKGSGKSNLVQRGLRRAAAGNVLLEDHHANRVTSYHATVQVFGAQKSAEILEIDSHLMTANDEGVIWPEGSPIPHGAMVCYDATNAEALTDVKRLLTAIWRRGGIVNVCLANKSSTEPRKDRVDPHAAAELCSMFGVGLIQLDGGIQDEAGKRRAAFGWIIRRILVVHGAAHPASRTSTSLSLASLSDFMQPTATHSERPSPSRHSSQGSQHVINTFGSAHAASAHDDLADDGVMRIRAGDMSLFVSEGDLIDKFLHATVAGNDEAFVKCFLVIYRRFSRPTAVLDKLIERFVMLTKLEQRDPPLCRYAQQRLCSALARWIEFYACDFALPTTHHRLEVFLEGLLLIQHLVHYAADLMPRLEAIVSDCKPEGPWALPDGPEEKGSMDATRDTSMPSSSRPSTERDSIVLLSRNMSISSTTAESSRRGPKQSRGLADMTLLDLSNAILESQEDALAMQITRLAWQTFSQLQPRDLIRYVLASRSLGELPGPVTKSISFVNYLAQWTASMILVQNRVKARARLVERMIGIASSLRELDNFDCCMGILAGLNAQPVFRLEATWGLLKDKPIYKRFRSLNRLMAASKGFAAYRIALETSKAERIPYLGCHLQDLTRIFESKLDMQDGLVNWSKFSTIASTSLVVENCRDRAPKLPTDAELERLIVGVPVMDDEALYALSYAIVPRKRSKRRGRLRALFSMSTKETT